MAAEPLAGRSRGHIAAPLPRAHGAYEINPPPSWIADIDGTTMLCVDQPGLSRLAVAANSGDALAAGQALGLTRS
ncbi:MAG: hypothetical protein M3460_21250 [Actinomycetota bacterium]|nr:hypothetical protein [Actinomycetota bacterium]